MQVYSIRDSLSMRFSAYGTDAEKETWVRGLSALLDEWTRNTFAEERQEHVLRESASAATPRLLLSAVLSLMI